MTTVQTSNMAGTVTGNTTAAPSRSAATGGTAASDFVRMLKKRKWVAIITFLLFMLATVGGTFLWQEYYPIYTAHALLEVHVPKTTEILRTNVVPYAMDNAGMERVIMTHIQLIKSEATMSKVANADAVKKTGWYAKHRGGERLPEDLAKDLKISSVMNTNLIRVSMSDFIQKGEKRSDLPQIVNAVLAVAVADAKKTAASGSHDLITTLQGELKRLKKEYTESRTDLATLAMDETKNDENRQAKTVELETIIKMELEFIADHESNYESANNIIEMSNEELAQSIEVKIALENDSTLSGLKYNLWSLKSNMERARKRLGDNHLNVLDLQEQVDSLSQEIDQRRDRITALTVAATRGNARAMVDNYSKQLDSLREKKRETQDALNGLTAKISELSQRRVSIKALQDDIDKINSRIRDLNILQGDKQLPLTIERTAFVPRERTWPKWVITIPLGFVLGLLAGIGLAFLVDAADKVVRTPSDISRKIGIPLVGTIPHLNDVDESIPDIRTSFISSPDSLISESFRRLSASLAFSLPKQMQRSILVTSAMPEDGRTTVALNFAASMANAGRKVLVVDANFHHPIIGKLFSSCPVEGFGGVLSGQADWRETIAQAGGIMSVMSAGIAPADMISCFSDGRLKQFIDEISQEFDLIVFDGAPCMIVSDAQALAAAVDSVLLVARAGRNTFGLVRRMKDTLTGSGANIAGIALNAARFAPGGYFRENYRAFYDYKTSV